ncbi:amino acid adenylation domain-containing protein [Legionella sp. km535]|uniref:amino acid adenylation domain-containing protein n=1 Tax=Legionella sp. km535 TaxID=2498107 RepID=UPI00351231CF
MGGDSIVSIQLSSRMRQRLGLVVSVRSIFNCRSIERLFDEELPKQQAEVPPLKSEQGVLEGDVPLLPIQRWFMAQPLANPNHYNQAFMIHVPALDRNRLQESINQLIAYHDNFRLLFAEKEKGRYQAQTNYPFHCLDVSLLDVTALQAQLTQWQSQFDIQQGPLFTVAYLYGYPDGSARIYFAVHHLIIDAVSWRILADDLCRLYQGERLGNKGSSYRQWVAALEGYGCKNQEEKEYWNGVMSDYIPINASLKTTVSYSVDLSFTKSLTSRLLHESGKAYNTQINDVLLTALGLSLSELTGHWVHHVVLEGHGREEINAEIDVSRTLGWFTTLFPVRIEVCQDLVLSLKRVKDAQRQIPQHGVGYGALFGYEQNPLPEISFNYLGQLDKGSVNDWELCSDSVGEMSDPLNSDAYLLNLNGWVSEGRLQFNIVSRLPEAALSVVTDKFIFYLKALVEHTASQSRTYLTCSDVEQVVAQDYLDRLQEHQELEAVYKASSLQQGFIYHALTQGDTDEAYRVQISWHYKAAIDKSKLKEAWHYAQRKYPALRLRFAWEEQVLQVVDKESRLHWNYIECADEAEIQDLKARDRLSTYDLSESGLFRVTLIKQHASHYTCIFNNHHAILDGWGVAVLLDYVHETYKRLCADEVIESSEDVSYLETQKYIQTTGSDKSYWEGYLSQLDERVCLDGLVKPGLSDVVVSEYKYIHKTQEQQLVLAQSLKIDLILLSQERGVTLNAILQYAWHKVLSVYGYSRQTTVGTVISGRNLPIDNLEQSAGLYINTVPLIVNHDERKVIDVIQQIQEDINEANSHSKVNLAELQSSGERLFDTLFVYENYPISQKDNKLNIIFDQTTTKLDYPLALICENDIRLRYASELFDEQVISKLLDGLVTILTQLVKNTEVKANNIGSISESSYKNIIVEKNRTDFNTLGAKTLHELFEKQAKETPYSIALEFNDRKYTYSEINAISNKIAFVLQNEFSIKRGDIVGLFLERSEFTFISILSVLKSGAAYLPIDINFPEQRVSYILEDAQVSLILTSNKQKNQLENITKQIPGNILNYLVENELCANNTDFESYVDNISCSTEPTDLAYVIYTSGTTGQPKGVMIEHRSIVSRLLWLKNTHKLEPNFIFGAKTSYVFDPSIREMFLPLISGSGIYIFSDEEIKDVERIIELCITKNINGLLFVPSQLVIFIEALKQCSDEVINQMPLKLIYSCGEALSANVVNELFECLPSLVVKNQYGPTEGCQFLFEKNIDNLGFLKTRTVNVGSLVGNMRAYVLDSNMVPLPELAIGELYISGDGLTRGYLNNDQLSNEKLLDNPFQSSEEIKESKNKKIYKTGDLVRWLPDGNLEYIGRNDFQIKIRGHRIDLGEIESVFLDYPGIKQVVVIAEKNKEGIPSNLIAYYVSNMEFSISLIYEFLKKRLPDYMLPKAIVHLTKMPMTINGKLNRAALPQYSLDHQLSDYIVPTTTIEKDLCEIYSEILDVEHVGISSNFFHLGGNSILSFKLVNRLRKILSQEVNIKHIYMCPTISDLLAFFESNEEYSEEGLEVEF